MIRLAPAVTVHSADDVRTALAPGLPVTLASAPGAALFAGAGWWTALMAAVRAEHPERFFLDLLDCGDAPGRAAEALRAGQRRLVLYGVTAPVYERVRLMAEALDAVLLPEMPEALDLARPGAGRKLVAWLGSAQGDNEGRFR